MWRWIRKWWHRRFGRPDRIDDADWVAAVGRVRGVRHLTAEERAELRPLVRRFLHEKEFVATEGFALTTQRKLAIAIQACIPVLHLGLGAYRRFRSIYVFPEAFRERGAREWRPERNVGALAGVAIRGGGVALAWSESDHGLSDDGDAYNPVIHEFAHQLDMIDGAADGRPELPPGVSARDWCRAFSSAFDDFRAKVRDGGRTRWTDYAATNPAEFFAVLSEVYFETPGDLEDEYPEVMRLLRAFYTSRGRDSGGP